MDHGSKPQRRRALRWPGWLRRTLARRATLRELAQLDDAMLADIGIRRTRLPDCTLYEVDRMPRCESEASIQRESADGLSAPVTFR